MAAGLHDKKRLCSTQEQASSWACGRVGQWRGDPDCPKVKSGETEPFKLKQCFPVIQWVSNCASRGASSRAVEGDIFIGFVPTSVVHTGWNR